MVAVPLWTIYNGILHYLTSMKIVLSCNVFFFVWCLVNIYFNDVTLCYAICVYAYLIFYGFYVRDVWRVWMSGYDWRRMRLHIEIYVVLGASGRRERWELPVALVFRRMSFFPYGFGDALNRKAPTKAEFQNFSFLTFFIQFLCSFLQTEHPYWSITNYVIFTVFGRLFLYCSVHSFKCPVDI